MTSGVDAIYRDPDGARVEPVRLSIVDRILFVRGGPVERSAPLETVHIPAVKPPAPRVVRFSDGTWCEVADREAFDALLASARRLPPAQWEGTPRALGLVLLGVIVAVVVLLFIGIPLVAAKAAGWIPEAVTSDIGDRTLAVLEQQVLGPSALPLDRRADVVAAFERLRMPVGPTRYRLEFRSSASLGPNAAALPSGTIVVTDDLVRLARDDREILGVLAHEAGHVHHRHGMRLLAQQSFLALAAGLLIGDFSSLVAIAPTALLQAKYSRDVEREADVYAADVLRANGIAPARLADVLERIDAHERARRSTGRGLLPEYLASHPATEERLEYLRNR